MRIRPWRKRMKPVRRLPGWFLLLIQVWTAQQVENNNATLQAFMQEAQTAFKAAAAANRATGLHFGCLIRQEGGPWRSGSTYLVQLAPNGRVFLHAKNMALSGNLLDSRIVARILASLLPGVDLTNPIAVRNGLLAEPIAGFNAPALGVSGHASAYEGGCRGSDHTARRIRPQRIPLGPRTNRLRRSDHSRPRRGGPQNLEGLRRERNRAI